MRSARGVWVAGAVFLGASLLISGGCGVKTPPVPPKSVVPNAIDDLRFTVADDLVRMTWSYPLETIKGTDITEVSRFNLYPAEIEMDEYCPTCPVPFVDPIEVDGGQTVVDGKRRVASYEYDMLRPGYKYFFKVKSQTGWWAQSADSNIITFIWHVPPAAPTDLSASAKDSNVKLRWNPVTTRNDGEPVTTDVLYQVLRSNDGTSYAKTGAPVETTRYTDGKVTNGKTYFYQVQSVLRFGEDLVYGDVSNDVTVTPLDTTPPPAPENVLVFETGSGIRVVWDASPAADTAGYKIYRRIADSSTFKHVGTVKIPNTTFIDSKVKDDELYYYRVTAFDSVKPPNESDRSREATPRY